MAGIISTIVLSDGTRRYRARYRDAGGRQHEKRYTCKVDAQHWLAEQISAMVTRTWTAPERAASRSRRGAEEWAAAQTGLKPSTLYGYRSILKARIVPR